MGKSTSCFKIITCGNDSADRDDLEASELKGSSEKRGWSFRKRSARHRVLSNTAITETPTSGHKEIPESTTLNFQPPASTTVPEKISVIHCSDEKPHLLTPETPKVSETEPKVSETKPKVSEPEPKVSETEPTGSETEPTVSKNENAAEDQSAVECKLDESDVTVVETAVRGLLAQRAILELKNVVKLQAVVRGHLVRRRAVGTLRCVQALVKMQALVRARRARLSLEQLHLGGEHEKDNRSSKTLEKKNLAAKANITYISIEKLLSNRFAHQLLESTPKTTPIHVKCVSSKPNSSWMWLERWTSVSSVDIPESKKAVTAKEQQERENEENSESPLDSNIQDEVLCEISDSKSSIKESIVPSESEENLITYDADNLNFQASHSTSYSESSNIEEPQLENTSTSDVKETSAEINFLSNQSMQSDADSQVEFKSFSGKPGMETEQPKYSMKRLASEQLETEGRKSGFGSRKVSNPAFITAHSKFEELSSTTNSGISSSPQEFSAVESERDTLSAGVDTEVRANELSLAENPVTQGSRVEVGGSECGTEISISSTLDSPNRSDVGAIEHENEAKVSEEGICSPNSRRNGDAKAKDFPTISVSNLSDSVLDQPEKIDVVIGESINTVVAMDFPQIESKPERIASDLQREQDGESKPERTTSDLQREQDTEAALQVYGSSPEASPRSHLTVPESQGTPQGTPSSLISVKGKRSKAEKSGSNQKRKSPSAVKKSPANPNHDSSSSKDQKNGKRRNSFGSARPAEQSDQEPRDSSSNNSSVPRFMQATESARAKLQANASPRSSPDVQDRDIYIKKRHSLPGENGRQGSPRIQRSTSQAQQGAKGNERKWNR